MKISDTNSIKLFNWKFTKQSLHCHWGPWVGPWSWCSQSLGWCPWPELPPKDIGMPIVCAVTWSHVDAHEPCFCWSAGWSEFPVWVQVDVHSLCCHVCILGPEAAGGRYRGLYCHQKPYGSPWSMPPLTVKSKDAGSSGRNIDDCRCTVERQTGKTSRTSPIPHNTPPNVTA